MKRIPLLGATLFLAVGCASTASIVRFGKSYAPKPEDCKIEVFMDAPSAPFEKIGLVSAASGQHWAAGKTFEDMLPAMKEEACRAGADAIIVKDIQEAGFAWIDTTQARASATAIKYTSTTAPTPPPTENL